MNQKAMEAFKTNDSKQNGNQWEVKIKAILAMVLMGLMSFEGIVGFCLGILLDANQKVNVVQNDAYQALIAETGRMSKEQLVWRATGACEASGVLCHPSLNNFNHL